MSNKAAYGPGPGPIGFERLGVWKTSPTDQATFGPPLIFTAGTYQWRSTYGVLYKITGVGGGGGNFGTTGGSGGGGFMLWWVGDGSTQTITVGAGGASNNTGGTTSFGSISSATGGASGYGGAGAGSGQGLLVSGLSGTTYTLILCGVGSYQALGGASAFGLGKGGETTGTNGVLIIEVVPPMLNSQAQPWNPGYMAP